jgi:hypothetical protein
MMKEAIAGPQLTRLRAQLQQLRRGPEWHFVKQICTAAAADKETDWKALEGTLTDEVAFLIEQEVAAAKERAR